MVDPDDDDSGGTMFAPAAGPAGARTGPWSAFETATTYDFLSEEFGLPNGGAMGGRPIGNPDDDDGPGSFGGGLPGAAMIETDRYVDDEDSLPYKTRAFLLSLRIREADVPRMLAELTDSSFPVEIVRVDLDFNYTGAPGTRGGGVGYSQGSPDEDDYEQRNSIGGGNLSGLGGLPSGLFQQGGLPQQGRLLPNTPVDNSPAARMKADKAAREAQQAMSAATADPSLIVVRVGGLMTLYQSKEEAVAQNSNEAAAQQESGGAAAPAAPDASTPPAPDGSAAPPTTGDAPPAEAPAADPAATDPAATDPPATDPPATDPAAADPAAGS